MKSASLFDRLAAWWQGGIRIRILCGGTHAQGAVIGELKGLSGEEALQLVLDLQPPAPGIIHIKTRETKHWSVKVTGPLAEENFAQRVRNELGLRSTR